jgi:hypothetical protein
LRLTFRCTPGQSNRISSGCNGTAHCGPIASDRPGLSAPLPGMLPCVVLARAQDQARGQGSVGPSRRDEPSDRRRCSPSCGQSVRAPAWTAPMTRAARRNRVCSRGLQPPRPKVSPWSAPRRPWGIGEDQNGPHCRRPGADRRPPWLGLIVWLWRSLSWRSL